MTITEVSVGLLVGQQARDNSSAAGRAAANWPATATVYPQEHYGTTVKHSN